MIRHPAIFAVLLSLSAPAFAQDTVLLWTGGVGIEERESAPKDGTKLVFFAESGKFLAGVQVSIKDASGKEVLNAVSKGPWMILDLVPGRYSVRATVGDQAQGGFIDVSDSNQQFAYRFKGQ